MRLIDKTEKWSMGDKKLVGKKKKYTVNINFSAKNPINNKEHWWYSIFKEDINFTYNSLWDNLKYETQEECVEAAEKKIDELLKQVASV